MTYSIEKESIFGLINETGTGLTEQENSELRKSISVDELKMALFSMENNKAPGTDGLTAKFYKYFWEDLSEALRNLYLVWSERRIMNVSACTGVISLLPKGGSKDPSFLKNWRPLTLLNMDYKILAKTLALRLKPVLQHIIGPQQTGFLAGRQITDNIVKTMDIITDANTNLNSKIIIVTVDFEKCFDKITYPAIFGSLRYFGVSETFIKWVQLFFTEFGVMTQNAGYCSKRFVKQRSINQGCPISPYLYLCCGEILAHKLMGKPAIKGITVNEVKMLLSQFADDTVLYLNYDLNELNAVIQMLEYIEAHTGLKMSYDKTMVYRVGSLQYSDSKLITRRSLNWSDEDIDLLGVKIPNNGKPNTNGFKEVLSKVRKISESWFSRSLTLMGRVLIVNILFSSNYIYKMMVLTNMTTKQILEINNKLVTKFIWKNKKSKLKLSLLQNPRKYGGLKLNNFDVRQKVMKISWIPKIVYREDLKYVHGWLLPKIGSLIWEANLSPSHIVKLIPIDSHWRRVLISWAEYHYHDRFSGKEVLNEMLWYNSNICINNLPFCFEKCLKYGIKTFQDLLDKEGNCMGFDQISAKYDNSLNWFEYVQVRDCIPTIFGI